ncbi:MAG: DNA/RNA nuclease SfsA [Desulfobacteraceae bacterium]
MGLKQPFEDQGLRWPKLYRGRLIKRYKRFLADVTLDSGEIVTAHCSNSGRMTGCNQPGRPVYLSFHDNPKRKLKYTWELIEMPTSMVGVNTLVPNRLVAKAVGGGLVPELAGYETVASEVRVNKSSRLDLKLSGNGLPDAYVEIKNCTLVEEGCARFPDAPTLRGQKHLKELARLKADGARAVIFFLVQRTDAERFRPADDIDPAYGRLLREVAKKGVEPIAYDVEISTQAIRLRRILPCVF